MTKLVSLALAAEARGRAQAHLDLARRQNDRIRADLEQQARDLAEHTMRTRAIAAKPGEQLRLT